MDKIFMEMFSRQPDEIINGDYLYHLPYYEDWTAETLKMSGVSFEELKEMRERSDNIIRSDFKFRWDKTTLPGEIGYVLYEPWTEHIEAIEIVNKIASECKPFMDIASSQSMGLAPYIVNINPQIPCLVTDIDVNTIKFLRSCIDENLMEYNISLASFDNIEIPLKDNSLDYITSRYGITSSSGFIPVDGSKMNIYQHSADKEKPINEVYRLLKPGGRFITLEMNTECDFDLQKIYDYYNKNGSLFGIYTYDEIQAVLKLLKEEPWRDKFISAGFLIEVEKKHYKKYTFEKVMSLLHDLTSFHAIRHWEKRTWLEQRQMEKLVQTYKDEAIRAEDIGISFYDVDIFFVLRKPD